MQEQPDFFARIAQERSRQRSRLLEEPAPLRLPDRTLPCRGAGPGAPRRAWAPERKLATAEDLRRELELQRRRHAPFLRDLAPPVANARLRRSVVELDWRVETAQDRTDFPRVLRGEGEWQRVRVPHFGPPLGSAVTFYRTSFEVTLEMTRVGRIFLCFGGVDYTAAVFVNGALVGTHEGFFAAFEMDATANARVGSNTLVVRVGNDYIHMGNEPADGQPGERYEGEKIYAASGPGYDDPILGWHHCPPGMGIYQAVAVEARPEVFLSDLFVRPMPEEHQAEAWVEVTSCGRQPRPISLDLSVYGQNFRRTVLRGRRFSPSVRVVHGAGDVPGKEPSRRVPVLMGPGANLLRVPLEIPSPKLWCTETPWLYQLQVRLRDQAGEMIDSARCQFGMRSFAIREDTTLRGKLFLNGREIRLRGANTMGFEQQDVMRGDLDRLRDDILLAKICRMNFLRLTQRPVQAQVYDLCDRLGLMTQTDLPLFGVLRRTRFAEAVRQAGEMERLVRSHPSNVLVSFINEAFPNGMNEPHRHLTRPELDAWVEAASRAVRQENPDRVIKPHDGDYDPPGPGLPDHHCYCGWYNGHGLGIGKLHRGWWQPAKPGWHYACGEFGAEGLDPVALMRRRYPPDWLPATAKEEADWSPDRIQAAQTGRFQGMWFDRQHTLQDWVDASQAHQAWVIRLMTEAFRRDARMNSFAVHLFIDAWPAGWMKTILDTERTPKPAYFAYRDALSPILVSLRTDRFAVRSGEVVHVEAWLANDADRAPRGARLLWQASLADRLLYHGETAAKLPSCSSRFQGHIVFAAPTVSNRSVLRVGAAVRDEGGRTLHESWIEVTVFPTLEATRLTGRALILGSPNGLAARLARGLGIKHSFGGSRGLDDLILADDLSAYAAREKEILGAVRNGAIAVLLEVPTGQHRLASTTVHCRPTGMGEFFFVSRATGHPLVRDLEPRDFFLWYDPPSDCIMPILGTTLEAEGWETVLETSHLSWSGSSRPAQACAQKRIGKGALRICQVRLAGMLVNPVVEIFARRLIAKEALRGAS